MQDQKQALPARLSHLDKAPTKPATDEESRHDASSDFVLAPPSICRICHNTRWCQDITPRNGKDLTGGSLGVMGRKDGLRYRDGMRKAVSLVRQYTRLARS